MVQWAILQHDNVGIHATKPFLSVLTECLGLFCLVAGIYWPLSLTRSDEPMTSAALRLGTFQHGLSPLNFASSMCPVQWINSGAIECREGGGHFRPNKHAELARDIFRALERGIGEARIDPLIPLLARKVQTK